MKHTCNHSVDAAPGFTLLELVVVLAITGVLFAMTLVAVRAARDSAARVECANNLRQIGIGLLGYENTHHTFPSGIRRPPDPYPYMGWAARILPYLEQEALLREAEADYQQQPNFWVPVKHPGLSVTVQLLVCPADGRGLGMVRPEGVWVGLSSYLGVLGLNAGKTNGVLFLNSQISIRDILDGTSNTLLVGERPPSPDNRFGWWYAGSGQAFDGGADMVLGVSEFRTTFYYPTCPFGPYRFGPGNAMDSCDTFHFWSGHNEGANFLFADGSCRFLSYSANALLPALASRAGGEVVELP
jgi:prepilin-type N-terminal cleavage/methylation domain-containing protein/prepilin-type processing-associated H-X9-DG protein